MLAAPNFDFSKQKKTTGWHNNCGFNCLSHLFASKLENQELQARFGKDPIYAMLLKTFQEYYGLSQLPTWDQINTLRQQYPVPTDWEAIFSPVLRKHLEKVLMNNAEQLWNELAVVAFSDYLVNGNVDADTGHIFLAMIEQIGGFKAIYDSELAKLKLQEISIDDRNLALVQLLTNKIEKPTEGQIRDQVHFQRRNNLQFRLQNQAKRFWMEKGCRYYASWMGDLKNGELASINELDMLTKELSIGLQVFRSTGLQFTPEHHYVWLLKIYNEGLHWTLEDENAQRHNVHYPYPPTMEFVNNDALSGKFKTYVGAVIGVEQNIISAVRASMEKMLALNPAPVAPAILSAFRASVAPTTVASKPVVVKQPAVTTVNKENVHNGLVRPKTIHDWLALPEDQIRALYNQDPQYAKIVVAFFEGFGLGVTSLDGFLLLMNMLKHPLDREILFGAGIDTSKGDPKASVINRSFEAAALDQIKISDENKTAFIKQLIQTIYQRKIVPALVQKVTAELTKAKI